MAHTAVLLLCPLVLCSCLPSKDELVDPDNDGSLYGEDCDNSDAAIHPDASEVWYDDLDNDCDPSTSDDDADEDGYHAATSGGEDCDDTNAAVNPAAGDIVDGYDQNCDGVDGVDQDRDGFASEVSGGEDCDDLDGAVNPDAGEVCDDADLDEDCNGVADDDDPGVLADSRSIWYADEDEDSFGDPDQPVERCSQPVWAVNNGDDCDDTNDEVNPDEDEEFGDGRDNNCDGSRDSVTVTWTSEYIQFDIIESNIAFDLGIVETDSASSDPWTGEDCLNGYWTGAGDLYLFCHPMDETGGTLYMVDGFVDDIIEGETSIFPEYIDQRVTTFVLWSTTDDECWTWGHDTSYYTGEGCIDMPW